MFRSKAKAERERMYVLTKMLSEWNRGYVLIKDESSPQEMTLVARKQDELRGEREGQRRTGKERRGKRKRKRKKEKGRGEKREGEGRRKRKRRKEKRREGKGKGREGKKKEREEKKKEEKEEKRKGRKKKRGKKQICAPRGGGRSPRRGALQRVRQRRWVAPAAESFGARAQRLPQGQGARAHPKNTFFRFLFFFGLGLARPSRQ